MSGHALVDVAHATVVATDSGPMFVYPTDGYDTAELHVAGVSIVLGEAESKVLGLVLSGEQARVIPEDEPMPDAYRAAAKAVWKDLDESIKSWGRLDIAGSIHDGKGDAVKDELNGLLAALRRNLRALRDMKNGDVFDG